MNPSIPVVDRPIVDLFSGCGGWSEGLRTLGLSDVGLELNADACASARAAGHAVIRADVRTYPIPAMAGLIGSPPCPDFSTAGKMIGRAGESGRLINLVPEWVEAGQPDWIACEQVPPCLPIWREHAHLYRQWGYSVWCGILNAADYGAPQTRERAILMASRDGAATPPPPTHGNNRHPSLLDAREPWVSMETVGIPRGAVDRRTNSRGPGGSIVPTALVPTSRPSPTLCQPEKWILRGPDRALTLTEGLTLQGFRPDYPIIGATVKSLWLQVSNAVPPPLAAAVLGQLVKVPVGVAS